MKNKGAANCTMIEWNLHVGFDPATINTGCFSQSAPRAPHVGCADRSLIGARHNYRTPNVSQALRATKKPFNPFGARGGDIWIQIPFVM